MGRKFWLSILFSGAIIALILLQIKEPDKLISALRSVRYPPLIAASLVLTSTQFIKSWRWKYLLQPVKQIKAAHLVPPTAIGAMADMVFPARTGEFIRAYLIGQKEQVSKVSSLATIVVEKIFDILTLLFIAALMLIFMSASTEAQLPPGFDIGVYAFALAVFLLCAALWLLRLKTEWMIDITGRLLRFLPAKFVAKVTDMMRAFATGLHGVKTDRSLVHIVAISLFLWAVYALSNFLILQSFNIELPFYAAFVFLVFQILGVTLPSSPGFVGTYHGAVLVGFAIFNVSQELALSVAIIMHAAFFFPFILLGFFFVWQENLSFSQLRSIRS